MRARRTWRTISLLFSFVLIGFQGIPVAMAAGPIPSIIDNGSLVQLGINPEGHLNVPGGTPSFQAGTTSVGVRFIPTNGEATAPGCLCEGWGVANADSATGLFSGYANVAVDGVVNLTVQPGTGTYPGPAGETTLLAESVGTRFKSITTAPTPGVPATDRVRVTQDYHPTLLTANLYQVDVTIENIGTTPIGDLRYRRVMDWDIAPTTFNELVEIHVGTSANLVQATTDGFMSGDPLSDPGPYVGNPPTTLVSGSPDYTSPGGPDDQGSLWDFKFGALPAGESKTFRIFYGGAPDRTQALAAINAVGAEMYSFGMPSASDVGGSPPDDGKPNTFIFAFSGVGGTSVSNPQLTPESATNPLGQQHTLTANVTNGSNPVVGTTVTFTVLSGPNVGVTGTDVTDTAGNATFSYTSSTIGTDVIEATFTDTSGTHHSNRVTKEWTEGGGGGTTLTSLSDAHLWLGLRNSDDQGTQFDVRVELFRNAETAPIASGLTRCVTRLTRNPTFAQDVTVHWDPFSPVSLDSGAVLSVRISTRIGTNLDGSKCAGPGGSHNNAVALRFYYDASNRDSRFDTTIGATTANVYFHSDGGGCDKPSATRESQNVTTRFLNSTAPTGTLVKCKDSTRLNFAGGNPYAVVSTWSQAPLP